jgi:hypothetical protein
MAIVWAPTLTAVQAATVAGGLATEQTRVAGRLQSAGTAYDNAGTADAAALTAFNTAVAAWTATYKASFQAADQAARYALSVAGQVVPSPLDFDTGPSAYDSILSRISSGAAVGSKLHQVVRDALDACREDVIAQHKAQPIGPPAPTQPPTEAPLNQALADAADFLALAAFT